MQITGQAVIFKNDKGYYSMTISNKKEDNTYENMYITTNFKKGVELENKTKINIKNGFLSFYTNKDNNKILKVVITEFEIIEENTVTDDDLPF